MNIKRSPLDKLFSLYVRLRAGGKCEYCGAPKLTGDLECSHFIGRRNRAVRYDPDNAAGCCFSCHVYLGENPYKHTEFLLSRLHWRVAISAQYFLRTVSSWVELTLKGFKGFIFRS